MDLEAEHLGHRGIAAQLLHAAGRGGKRQRAALTVARRLPRLRLKTAIELARVAREARHVHALAQLSDETCGVPGRAAGELLALKQHDVAPTELAQVVGDRAADDAAADNDDARTRG